ncbi:Hypothetical protein FKW44_019320, partial [Caligus rogercresseyi]
QLAHAVQRKLVQEANSFKLPRLTADGTTDISSSEQFFLPSTLLHQTPRQTSVQCIVDIFLRLNLPIEKLQ